MTCTQCKEKEVTAQNITGSLCTSCFFANKNGKKHLSERASIATDKLVDTTTGVSINPVTSFEPIKIDSQPLLTTVPTDQNDIEITQEEYEYKIDKEHHPVKQQVTEIPKDGKRYCQSCLERGYGLNLATREWTPSYFICDDCFQPLLSNVMGTDRAEVERVITRITCDSPILNQIYDLLNIPEALRFSSSDTVLLHRNQIFNHHAQTLVNKSFEEVQEHIEFLQTILFQIKVNLEPYTDYINKVKSHERAQKAVSSVAKGKAEVGKGLSKVKMSAIEKEAKAFGMTVEQYTEMTKVARQAEFDKITKS